MSQGGVCCCRIRPTKILTGHPGFDDLAQYHLPWYIRLSPLVIVVELTGLMAWMTSVVWVAVRGN